MTDITRLLASLKRRTAHAKEFGHDVLFVKLEDLDALVAALDEARAQSFSGLIDAFSKDVANTGLDDSSTVTIFECKEALKHVAEQLREGDDK
ncbi:hypothetical protein [Klebsiella aerogenes]|uniref:hypothetical protein n=1 Tax=Klebsiella aerogenes TaxID=548 RepID=UPI00292E3531|nr:hypothetical protein [Klebsiella aerogenes]